MATPLDTVTLVLSGEVPLADFAKAISDFNTLIKSLSVEAGGPSVEWLIADLEISSTVATARGLGEIDQVEKVVRAYADVGTALENDAEIPFSKSVKTAAHGLRSILNGRISSIRFETAEREVIIRSRPVEGEISFEGKLDVRHIPRPNSPIIAYGSVEGRVQTLTSRGGLRFTLYDLLHDKAVSCYLKEGYENLMRNAWGKLAIVAGWVTRDPLSGRPLGIRQVTNVTVRAEETGSYRDARGVSPSLTDLLPEAAIRKLRDA